MNFRKITRIKNVTNTEESIGEKEAYLDKTNGMEFLLHFPNRFRKRITDTKKGKLIVLYQRMGNKNKRYLTHLVETVDKKESPDLNSKNDNYKFGREVKVIAFAGNKIPYKNTQLKNLNFRNKGWGNAVSFEDEKFVNPKELSQYQKHLLELFEKYMD